MMRPLVELGVVVPVYGCRECLQALHERLTRVLAALVPSYEILLVDDRSPDQSWVEIEALAAADPHLRAIRLSRNFGQHAAITSGLAHSRARWTVVMDCDLQDPPESIPELLAKAREGYDVVLARRRQRSHSAARQLLARFYFWLVNLVMGTRLDGEYGTFSILSDRVRQAFLRLHERDRHYLFILNWLGFQRTSIEIAHGERLAGRSAYSIRALIRHAVSGVFFQTSSVLVYIVYLGFAFALAGVALALYFLYLFLVATPPPGFTSLIVVMLLIGGVTIMCTGVTGLYIGRVFEQVKDRPLFVVDREIGGDTAVPPTPAAELPVGAGKA